MNIFCDLHHSALYKSLSFLLEKRLEHKLYRPIGTEWYDRGYWTIAQIYGNHPDTIKQYLQIRDAKPTKMGMVNEVKKKKAHYYVIANPHIEEKAITFKQFKRMQIDVVIASYYGNIYPYCDLVNNHKPSAKFVVQMGNDWPIDWSMINNLMASTQPVKVPKDKNAVFYHQEFDLETYRKGEPDPDSKLIRSYIHCLQEHEINKQDWEDFLELEKLLPKYKFESFGTSCRDGVVKEQQDVADGMRASKFGFHLKNKGDGFGHVIHNWFAVGRPVIYRKHHYMGKLACELLEHGVTGIDADKVGIKGVADFINGLTKENYIIMCNNVYNRFKKVVDYDKEAEDIKKFLKRLI